jgi:hypothetical protein
LERGEIADDLEPPVRITSRPSELLGIDVGVVRELAVGAQQRLAPALDLDWVRRAATYAG